MYINKIKLQNFRNYNEQEINLNKSINVFYGDNAQGKTNILEAIFLCTFGKSFRTNKEKELIKLGKDNANVIIEYEKKDRDGKISISISDKKQILVNGIKMLREKLRNKRLWLRWLLSHYIINTIMKICLRASL